MLSKRASLWLALLALPALAQSPAFEAASVKPNRSGKNASSLVRDGARLTLENCSLLETIAFAYAIPEGREYRISGPGWLDAEHFDIVAAVPREVPREQVRRMLQSLLADRFALKVHHESRVMKGYALLVAKGGAKLTPGDRGDGDFTYGDGQLTARAVSMDALADRLSGPIFKLDRPVINQTAIPGVFGFTLRWTPDGTEARDGPSMFHALEEQMGLKLEARDLPVDILVIDRAERVPTGN